MVRPLQIIAMVFAAFAWSRVLARYQDKKMSWQEFTFWTFVWAAVIIVGFVPDITFVFSERLGIERGVDVVIYLSVLVIFYLVFRLYVRMETIEQSITKLVREITLRDKKK